MKKLSNKAKVEEIKNILDRVKTSTVYELPNLLKDIAKVVYDITPEEAQMYEQMRNRH